MSDQDVGLVGRVGPVEVDWPRTLGYFGGAAAAVAFGVVEPPLGVVIVLAPFARMLDFPGARRARRLVGQVLEGAVKPIGGDDEGTIRLTPGAQRRQAPQRRSTSQRRQSTEQRQSSQRRTGSQRRQRSRPSRASTAEAPPQRPVVKRTPRRAAA